MRILLLTPGINKKYNDNYHSYRFLARSGNPILAISNIENINKGGGEEVSPVEEQPDDGLRVYRIFETVAEQGRIFIEPGKYSSLADCVGKFEPDLIFCENVMNIHLARRLKKDFNLPLLLRVEFAYHPSRPYRYLGRDRLVRHGSVFDRVGKVMALGFWKWVCRQIDGLISCYYGDAPAAGFLLHRREGRVRYVPWPTHLPAGLEDIKKDRTRGIYVGAFEPHKNLDEFTRTLPDLFRHTPLKKFYLVGAGKHGRAVAQLKSEFGDKIVHLTALGRFECLRAIGESYFTYAPAKWGGWGLIGDSWAMRTPIVVTCNHYDFHAGCDAVVTDREHIVQAINRLFDDEKWYRTIQEGGYQRFYRRHRSDLVGEQYGAVMREMLLNRQGARSDD